MATLSHDALWPRAGDWPGPDEIAPGSRIALGILGVPAYRTSLSPTHAYATPAAVRAALRRYSPALMPRTDLPGDSRALPRDLGAFTVVDFGDVVDPDSAEGEAETIARVSAALDAAQLLVALGGDNSLTLATALGSFGERLADAGLITLDAHLDLRDGISNGSPVRRLVEAGLNPERIVQIGIADFANSPAYLARAAEWGITLVHRDALHHRRPDEVMAEALEIAGAGGGPIHLDIDLDVCDRAVAPATPASVPGGLAAWEVRALVRAAASDSRLRSADIAEIDAHADSADQRTVRLAALCVLEILAGLALRNDANS